jgi:hypothetical protein
MRENLNGVLIACAIIGLIAFVVVITTTHIDIKGQGPTNQTANTTQTIKSGNATEEYGFIEEPLANLTSEAGTIEGIEAPEAGAIVGPSDTGRVNVISTCKIGYSSNSPDCQHLQDNLFRVVPSYYLNNHEIEMESNITPSTIGRMVTFKLLGQESLQYLIQQKEPIEGLASLFNINKEYSLGCKGFIKAGESKDCTIKTTLTIRPD